MKTRTKYTDEIKRAAVARMATEKHDVITKSVGCSSAMLYRWRNQMEGETGSGGDKETKPAMVIKTRERASRLHSPEVKAAALKKWRELGGGAANANLVAQEMGLGKTTPYYWSAMEHRKKTGKVKAAHASGNGNGKGQPGGVLFPEITPTANFCPHCGGDIRAVNMALALPRR